MNAYITAIATYLPERVEENPEGRLRRKTGIARRHIAAPGETAADLAVRAAEGLFAQGIGRGAVDFLLLCTQSPDYPLPTTACLLQHRLGLATSCGALDFNLGCSGFIYGLGLAKGLVESGQARHVLLLTAETYSAYIHPQDGSARPLFGDAAAATLVEAVDTDVAGITAPVYGTDGSGAEKLIVRSGGARHPFPCTPEEVVTDAHGNVHSNRSLFMNGAEISAFALDVVPPTVEAVLQRAGLARADVDYYVFHQANRFMLEFLCEKCALQERPFWNDVTNYGNTVSASIPIALCDLLRTLPSRPLNRVMLAGFGVGLSWGGCLVNLSRLR